MRSIVALDDRIAPQTEEPTRPSWHHHVIYYCRCSRIVDQCKCKDLDDKRRITFDECYCITPQRKLPAKLEEKRRAHIKKYRLKAEAASAG